MINWFIPRISLIIRDKYVWFYKIFENINWMQSCQSVNSTWRKCLFCDILILKRVFQWIRQRERQCGVVHLRRTSQSEKFKDFSRIARPMTSLMKKQKSLSGLVSVNKPS